MKRELGERLTAEKLNNEGCLLLVQTIVKDAANDYRSALVNLRRHPSDPAAQRAYDLQKKFFLSKYFHALTGLDGQAVMDRLDAEY